MGRFNSAFTFTGKVGTIHGYTLDSKPGVTFVGRNGGPTKEDFLFKSSMLLTRENSQEFGGCSLGAKKLYKNLPFELRMPLSGSYKFFLKNVIKLCHLDTTGLRGQRSIFFHNIPNLFRSIIVGKNSSELNFTNLISAG
jgi:hypothetical protein